jgi:hypothetical protein
MASLDPIQMLTFFTGAVVILCTVFTFKSPEADMRVKTLIDILQSGLGFWLVAYTSLVVHDGGRRKDTMYKYLIVLVSVAAWLLWIFNGEVTPEGSHVESTRGGWKDVAEQVARPLALGSMFALPYLWYNW